MCRGSFPASHVEKIRLADLFLSLDTTDLPPSDDGFIYGHHSGVTFLSGPGLHSIRVRSRCRVHLLPQADIERSAK